MKIKFSAVFALLPCLAGSVFSAADPLPAPIEALLTQAGGYSRYDRLTTLTYRFEDLPAGSTVPLRGGRRFFRLHGDEGFQVREESGDDVAVITSSGGWMSKGGATVSDAETLSRAKDSLLREMALVLMPHSLRENGSAFTLMPRGFFLGRLMDRWAVSGPALFPGGENPVIYLDRSAGKLTGLSFGTPVSFLYFSDPRETKSLLVFPARRSLYNAQERLVSTTLLHDITVNGFVDEALFAAPGATR